ncbi:MAG: hypothetical protein ACTHMC_05250 [Pseudobacter sp.]|uniref:hypothetical protein n=1 Tax=Pseudobacter sp. TaxID=2045420 RepID=UPI003F81E988
MANQTVNRQVNIYIASGEAEKAYDRLVKKEQQLKAELEKATDPKIINRLNAELNKLQEPIDRATRKMKGELEPSFRDVKNTVDALGKRLKQMSSSDADYTKVLVQYRAANVELQEQKKNLDAINSAKKNIAKDSDGNNSSFFGNLFANLAVKGIELMKSLGQQAIKTALETEGVRRAFDRLNQPELLDKLRTATKGTVSDLELMKRAVAADNFQIPVEKLGTLLEFAQRRARETGQSVDYLVDSIVTGIARKSPLILDNLGINIQRINTKFKETGDFAQAAFGVVDEELQKMGPALETNADKVDQWKARWTNNLSEWGAGLITTLSYIGDKFTEKFGTDAMKAEYFTKKRNQEIAAENEAARDRELTQIRSFQQNYAAADKTGRDKILDQVRLEIKTIETEEANASKTGLTRLAETHKIRLGLWQKYYDDLKAPSNKGDTIAALQKEIQLTTELRDNSIIGSKEYTQAAKRLDELQKRLDKLLGKNQPKAKENIFSRLHDQLMDQARELDTYTANQLMKDLNASKIKYDKQNRDLRTALDEQKLTLDQYVKLYRISIDSAEREHQQILEKSVLEYNKKRLEEAKKLKEKQVKLDEERMEQLVKFQTTLARNAAELSDKALGGLKFQKEVDLMLATGKRRLQIIKEQLDLEEKEEIAQAEKTGKSVADIHRKYDQLRKQESINHFVDLAERIADFTSNILTTVGQVFQTMEANENARIEDGRKRTEREKEQYKRQLDNKVITGAEYDRKVAALEKRQEEREKALRLRQFNREKAINFVSTTVQVARGVAAALATPPAPNIPLAALMGILGAVQLGIIATSKPPKMATGGILNGPSHAAGGMPVVDPRTRRVVAELEGGEAILSVDTVKNNFGVVSRLLDASMNKRGATIRPLPYQPKYVDVPAITQGINTVKMYAAGGVFEGGKQPSVNSDEVLLQLAGSVIALSTVMSNGIRAVTSLRDIEEQADRKAVIENDATMR